MRENYYETGVFLEGQLATGFDFIEWTSLQRTQYDFLKRMRLSPSSVILDVGCGPLRLGSCLIPEIDDGWYYGLDINPETLELGREVLARLDIPQRSMTLIAANDFDVQRVDRPVDIAFANSLFSHLTLNSISLCLRRVQAVLKPGCAFYSTFFLVPDSEWDDDYTFENFGAQLQTHPRADPYHYTESMISDAARQAGYSFSIDRDYGHQCQTMGVFTKLR